MPKHYKSNFKIGQVQIEFTKKQMTPYGGFSLVAKFFENIGLAGAVEDFIPVEEKSPNSMGRLAKVLLFFLTTLAGGKRFSHLVCLHHSLEIFCKLFDQARLPRSATTLTRFLGKIKSWQRVEELAQGLWDYLFGVIPWQGIKEDYLSFDSSVITRYGKQQGARKGYNPKKPGRPSHHPILAFLSRSWYIVNLWNRAGNARSSENIIEFARQTCLRLGEKLKLSGVLADSSFYEIDFIEFLENLHLKYVIAVKFYSTVQEKILSLENWQKVDQEEDIEIADFWFCHKAEKWDRPRRYFVVRHRVKKDEPLPVGKQLKLFPELEDALNYRYSAFLTDFDGDISKLWQLYRRRCDDENRVKEAKEDFGLEGFSLNNFYATEAAMLLRILIYNLFNLFRTQILSERERHMRASTILLMYFVIPGILGADGNQSILRLGLGPGKQRCKFIYRLHQVSRWFPPGSIELQCI